MRRALPLVTLAGCIATMDPAPGLARSKTWTRNLECERLTAREGHGQYPGVIAEPDPRTELFERAALVCRERFARLGLRTPREEAVLSELEGSASAIGAAAALWPELAGRTWLVEVFDPSTAVAGKIGFATKNALLRGGMRVSDRTPVLSAGDVDVLLRMPPDEAYPAACHRWADNGSLGAADVLLAVVVRDPRETFLHAGLCVSGGWTWLR